MTLTDDSGTMKFDFFGFITAFYYDIPDNQCSGLKLVDFIAETESEQIFIEAKNYVNTSDSQVIQAAMEKRQEIDYRMLTDPVATFPLEIGMKFKDSLFRCLVSGNEFKKPIVLLLIINPPPELKARDRERLISTIRNGYIPSNMHKKPNQYPKMQPLFFDMPNITEVFDRYGFRVSILS
ncbi:MAG: hypothetical protein FWH57_07290 [Oscillospiraceae bacterium]|nr:hypothetical protein [Oscillospiraceae bacterium]